MGVIGLRWFAWFLRLGVILFVDVVVLSFTFVWFYVWFVGVFGCIIVLWFGLRLFWLVVITWVWWFECFCGFWILCSLCCLVASFGRCCYYIAILFLVFGLLALV